MSFTSPAERVVSGMRATGRLHLGHYHGVLKNWVKLQYEYDCFFFVADWHALTTEYADTSKIKQNSYDLVVDWLAAGLNPKTSKIFIQSQVPEHAELNLLLSMCTPLSWLERVPTYKDQQQKLKDKDLATYGFLGYPLLMSADILMYRATQVPVGADQQAHVEITREIARRFNHFYGREPGFEELVDAAVAKMGKKQKKVYLNNRRLYREQGDKQALEQAQALVQGQQNIALGDRERLLGDLEGSGRIILPEPHALLTEASKMPGLDGQKMSKSYNNFISLREEDEVIDKKIRKMKTDPARIHISDPGNPDHCPVWDLHKIYSDDDTKKYVWDGCTSGTIGCFECKQIVAKSIKEEVAPMRERAKELEAQPDKVRAILAEGAEEARDAARATLSEVRAAMGLDYR